MQKQSSQKIIEELRAKGHRITGARVKLLEYIIRTDAVISVPELLRYLKKKKLRIDKATLYRNLDMFIRLGIIHPVSIDDNVLRFEKTDGSHHHHFICTNCRKIEHLKQEYLEEEILAEMKKHTKNQIRSIHGHTLNFYGLCSDCP
jgi:Fur family ferric uptake transcriptional regulator